MSATGSRTPDDVVIARLRAGAPRPPYAGPDPYRVLEASRNALRRRRRRQVLGGGVAATLVAYSGFALTGPLYLAGIGPVTVPGGNVIQGLTSSDEPPVPPRNALLADVERLEADVLPVVEELGLTRYLDDRSPFGQGCRVLTWSHGAFRDRDPECSNPSDPEPALDAASEVAFERVSDAIRDSGVDDVYRIEKGGWGPGTSFHLQDAGWRWNSYYSYVPGTPADAPDQRRSETRLGPRVEVHVAGDWWFTTEPDD